MAKMGRPKKENPKTRKLTVKMENDLYYEFTKKCEKMNLNKSTLIREWIVEFLENKKEVD